MSINPLFAGRKLNTAGVSAAHKVEELFSDLLATLSVMVSEGREFSIVKTKLEEASMFAKKALAVSDRFNTIDTMEASMFAKKEPTTTKYIVEYYSSFRNAWRRSANYSETLDISEDLNKFAFDTFDAAQAEATAQSKGGDPYRAVELAL